MFSGTFRRKIWQFHNRYNTVNSSYIHSSSICHSGKFWLTFYMKFFNWIRVIITTTMQRQLWIERISFRIRKCILRKPATYKWAVDCRINNDFNWIDQLLCCSLNYASIFYWSKYGNESSSMQLMETVVKLSPKLVFF